jgi:catechol 2,3-dioxygenase-like lactoylglutathione lyase family enzyme
MIAGAHTILYAHDAEAARAFFRDVLGLDGVDAGGGWLIFALPPGELACHPATVPGEQRRAGAAELYLMCTDIDGTRSELEAKGVEFAAPVKDEGFGRLAYLRVPGFGDLGLYEPHHPSPLSAFS